MGRRTNTATTATETPNRRSHRQQTCHFWQGLCGYKAVAETKQRDGTWKPICGQHLAALKRRKPPAWIPEIRMLAKQPEPTPEPPVSESPNESSSATAGKGDAEWKGNNE